MVPGWTGHQGPPARPGWPRYPKDASSAARPPTCRQGQEGVNDAADVSGEAAQALTGVAPWARVLSVSLTSVVIRRGFGGPAGPALRRDPAGQPAGDAEGAAEQEFELGDGGV